MTYLERQQVIWKLEAAIAALSSTKVTTPCNQCAHWRESLCGKFDAEPPADVLPVGCVHWEFDDVPF